MESTLRDVGPIFVILLCVYLFIIVAKGTVLIIFNKFLEVIANGCRQIVEQIRNIRFY